MPRNDKRQRIALPSKEIDRVELLPEHSVQLDQMQHIIGIDFLRDDEINQLIFLRVG